MRVEESINRQLGHKLFEFEHDLKIRSNSPVEVSILKFGIGIVGVVISTIVILGLIRAMLWRIP